MSWARLDDGDAYSIVNSTALPRDSSTRLKLVAPRGFEPQYPDSESGVLPLDDGAATALSVPFCRQKIGFFKRDSKTSDCLVSWLAG